MKHLFLSALIGLAVFSCNDNTPSEVEYDAAEQDITPTSEVNTMPVPADDSTAMSDNSTVVEHFDAALKNLEDNHVDAAADHMDMGISALLSERRDLQDSTHQEFDMLVEQLEDVSARLRAGEMADREQLQTLVDRAEMLSRE